MSPTPESIPPVSRREFLYYVWGASIAVLLAESAGAVVWFLLPRFSPGEFGGIFTVLLADLPAPGSSPLEFAAGRFWLVNVSEEDVADGRHPAGHATRPGVLALYKVCVHLGCLYQWEAVNKRFKCPCHSSMYLKDGTRIRKPATRDLDRLVVRAVDAAGNLLAATESEGQPLALPAGTAVLEVDTGQRILGRRSDGPSTA